MTKAEVAIILFCVMLALMPAELWFVNHFIYDFGYELDNR